MLYPLPLRQNNYCYLLPNIRIKELLVISGPWSTSLVNESAKIKVGSVALQNYNLTASSAWV